MNELINVMLDLIIGFLIGVGTRVKWVAYALMGVLSSLLIAIVLITYSISPDTALGTMGSVLTSPLILRDLLTFLTMIIGFNFGKRFINKIMEVKE